MVDYRSKLGATFDLSSKQIEILERNNDTLVRAIPGSGKTTILTLKIKNLLIDDSDIQKVCCISYTNVNVEDLENTCSKIIDEDHLSKIQFLTFHRFCLQYILEPFSYLFRSRDGFRPYKKIFNYREHGAGLIAHLRQHNISDPEIEAIIKQESIYYNFVYKGGKWIPKSNQVHPNTVIKYWNFLNKERLIDFNLINLLALLIIQENPMVRRAINQSLDWVFIDEFQDVSEIQCKIIEELRNARIKEKDEIKWFMVGDPNQSIYGFAGANPRSMYDMRVFFNSLNGDDCEIKLDQTHRCPELVFNFARQNYNEVLLKIKNCPSVQNMQDPNIYKYLEDLQISEDVKGNNTNGEVIFKNTLTGVPEIINLKFTELVEEEVCCIGITRYNSIDVYRQYKLQTNINEGEDFGIYSDLYRDYEDKYGFKYFSLFVRYLILKNDLHFNRVRFSSSVSIFLYSLNQLISDKILEENIAPHQLLEILVESCTLSEPITPSRIVSEEFIEFSKRLSTSMKNSFPAFESNFIEVNDANKVTNFNNINEPKLQGFIDFALKIRKEKATFEIKHIHKIKGLEYDQVILQKVEDLPHQSNNKIHNSIFRGLVAELESTDIYDYIQELNKLYVMLTRSKKNLYIIVNTNKLPTFINIQGVEIATN